MCFHVWKFSTIKRFYENMCFWKCFHHLWLITGFITRLTQCVPLVKQELLTLPEHLSVTQFLVLCVCFVDRCLSFCTFSFGHCVICSSSIYRFWLPPFGIFKNINSVGANSWAFLYSLGSSISTVFKKILLFIFQ